MLYSTEEEWQAALAHYRPYLLRQATLRWPQRLRAREDPSDIAQEALLEISRDKAAFRGHTEGQLRAWMHRILVRTLIDRIRHHLRQERQVGADRHLFDLVDGSSGWLVNDLAASVSDPESHLRKERIRKALLEALMGLPEDQRQAVEMHNLTGFSLRETAKIMGKSDGAVASLVWRGLRGMRKPLELIA